MSEILIDKVPVPPPPARKREKRLTDELKALPVGGSFVGDAATASCYIAFARHHKFTAAQEKQPDGRVRVWRTA